MFSQPKELVGFWSGSVVTFMWSVKYCFQKFKRDISWQDLEIASLLNYAVIYINWYLFSLTVKLNSTTQDTGVTVILNFILIGVVSVLSTFKSGTVVRIFQRKYSYEFFSPLLPDTASPNPPPIPPFLVISAGYFFSPSIKLCIFHMNYAMLI